MQKREKSDKNDDGTIEGSADPFEPRDDADGTGAAVPGSLGRKGGRGDMAIETAIPVKKQVKKTTTLEDTLEN